SQDTPITTPNLASIVQVIVNRGDWSEGNAISFLFEGLQGHYSVWSRDKNGNKRRPTLDIIYSDQPSVTGNAMAGFRFPSINVPQGVEIESASLSLTPDLSVPSLVTGLAHFDVRGDKSIDAAPFSASNNDVSGRSDTTAAQEVDINDAGVLNLGQSIDIDVTDIVQEISGQAGWCGGNAMAFTVEPYADNVVSFKFETYLSNPEQAPRLNITLKAGDPRIETGCQAQASVGQIDEQNQDVEQESSDYVRLNSNDLDVGQHPYIGLRFDGIRVLREAEILDARLEFTARGAASGDSPTVQVHVDTVDDSSPIIGTDDEIDDRFDDGSTAGIDWDVGDWTINSAYRSPNLKSIVQEIVDRGGWSPGNAMLFFVKKSTGNAREAYSYDSSPSRAPRLVILARGGTGGSVEESVRERLISTVEDFSYRGTTPLAEVLTEAAYYYRGNDVHFGRTRGSGIGLNDPSNHETSGSTQDDLSGAYQMRISHCSSYTGGTQVNPNGCDQDDLNDSDCDEQRITGSPVYISPIKQGCQSNNIVMLSDGEPNNNTENGLIKTLTGKSSCVGAGNGGCGIDLAGWMSANDQSDALGGDQKITTYTIGFGDDVGSGSTGGDYLQNMATAGGGAFFVAGESADLVKAFESIVAEILDKNTTFVAPAVTINSFNRLSHLDQLYFALFQPLSEPRWPGNLKRFRLDKGADSILDADGEGAVDTSTGFFKEDALSFWTTGGNDGGAVTKGGAESKIVSPVARNIYSDLSGSILTTAGNRVEEGNGAITAAMLGVDSTSDPAAQRLDVLRWARGYDVDDEDLDGSDTDIRSHLIGDPLHSEPVVVDYQGTEANPDLAIFMGTNQGYLHAIDSRTGQELYSFIPKELLSNLAHYRDNFGAHYSRPYGMDGSIAVDQVKPSKKTLIAGMRRGGRSYYALDVTGKTTPKILWTVKGGSGDFAALGQTWSRPVVANVQVGGASKRVVIFSGGYDVAQDSSASAPITDAVGQMIYMVDIEDGSLVWSAGNAINSPMLSIPGMESSIPASPRVVDLNSDGLIDRLYVGDMNGKVFRVDFFKENSGAADMSAGYLYATLGGTDARNNRRFYNEIDVALIESTDTLPILSVSLGSGYRAHPLEVGVQDRFYVLKDYDVSPVLEDSGDADTYRKPYFLLERDFDSNLDGELQETEKAQVLGSIVESELIDASSDSAENRVKFGRGRGGFIDMREGEKVLTVSRTFDNAVIFSTFEPSKATANKCKAGEGTSRLYQLDITNLGPKVFGHGDPAVKPRDTELPQGGIPPDPVVLFPEEGEPVICVGPFCQNPGLSVTTTKTYWMEN
ncbi:MAG: pilus assembly protein, partial [Oceanococcus sp.]